MSDFSREINELKEKITFCDLMIKHGDLVKATPQQFEKAFKVKGNLEEELRVLKMRAEDM